METEQIQKSTENMKTKNKMQEIEIEKMVLNCGGTEDKLEKSVKLLKMISGKTVLKTTSTRRIPAFGISPGKESGCKVTLRNKTQIKDLLERFFVAVDKEISNKKIVENQFSFGMEEYIEIPGLEYDRDIGILGFDITIVFKRKGKRVVLKKIKKGKYPQRQRVRKEEIIEFLNKNFGVEVVE
jgi:large subunit ribosomal protein L5